MIILKREWLKYLTLGVISLFIFLVAVNFLADLYLGNAQPNDEPVDAGDKEIDDVLSEQFGEDEITGEEASESDFFLEARLRRERVRSQMVEMLREIVNNPNSTSDARQQAQERLIEISEQLAHESEAEQMLEAKGFGKVIVYLMTDNALVMIAEEEIDKKEAAQIASVMVRVADLGWEDVSIVTRSDFDDGGE